MKPRAASRWIRFQVGALGLALGLAASAWGAPPAPSGEMGPPPADETTRHAPLSDNTKGAAQMQTLLDDAWATPAGFHFSGRLTEGRLPALAGSSRSHTLYRNARLLLTSGEEGAVRWSVGEWSWQTRADDRGYWSIGSNQPLTGLAPGWHGIDTVPPTHTDAAGAGLLVHDPRNTWGLISDIDDTVLVSEVLSKGRLLRNSLLLPPESREAVPGMAALYTGWLQRNPNPEATPVFYVSASPRQLTDSVRRFLRHNAFPRGVLQLKEIYSQQSDPLRDQQAYKITRIAAVFEAFPSVRFTLVGDDGERDPESFAELQTRYPGQIHEVWIRPVDPNPARTRFPGQQLMGPPEVLSELPR